MNLPKYGKIICRRCFKSCSTNVFQPHPSWQLRNDPGSWGGSAPEVLVLGFSKGSTQANIYENGKFEDVAFGGAARNRLDELLKRIGLLAANEHVTNEISDPDSRFAFGSLIRCSLTRKDKNGTHASSGELIVKSFNEVPQVLANCTEQYLSDLPKRTKIVLMLGVTDRYVTGCYERLKHLYPSLIRHNSVSYGDEDRIFIHVTHPSPGNGHFSNWCKGNSKFDDAVTTLEQRMDFEVSNKPETEVIIPVDNNGLDLGSLPDVASEVANSAQEKVTGTSTESCPHTRKDRVPVSTIKTFCVPFNHWQSGTRGYEIGENPVKHNGVYVSTYEDALEKLRKMNCASWRAHGSGPGKSNGGARKAIGWVTREDARRLLEEKDDKRRVLIFQSISDVVE